MNIWNGCTIAIMGIKGGTGKTIVAINVAYHLAKSFSVGIADCDIDSSNLGPAIGLQGKIQINEKKHNFMPKEWCIDGFKLPIKVMSSAFFTEDLSVFLKTGAETDNIVKDIILHTDWGELDYLILDLPAGSSGSAFRSIIESCGNVLGTVVVSLPNTIDDLNRCIDIAIRKGVRILGIIENMSGATCECGAIVECGVCGRAYKPLNSITRVEEIAKEYEIPYMGSIPLVSGMNGYIFNDSINKPIIDIVNAITKQGNTNATEVEASLASTTQ